MKLTGEGEEPRPVVLFGEQTNSIATVLSYGLTDGVWSIGSDALHSALSGESVSMDHLIRMVRIRSGETIREKRFRAEELLERYLHTLLDTVKEETGETVDQLTIAVEPFETSVLDAIVVALMHYGMRRTDFSIISHSEAVAYEFLRRVKDPSNLPDLILDIHGGKLYSYDTEVRLGRPQVLGIKKEERECFDPAILRKDSGRLMADSILTPMVERILNKKRFGTVVLTSTALAECTSWGKTFLKEVGSGRRVFYQDSLFARGAALHAEERSRREKPRMVVLSEGRVPVSISMEVLVKGRVRTLVLVPAGTNWYEAETSVDLILDGTDRMELRAERPGERGGTAISLPLEGFPARKNKTGKIRLSLSFESESDAALRVTDLGFGAFYPPTSAAVDQRLHLQ